MVIRVKIKTHSPGLAMLKCKEKVQKKVFLKDDHLAQEPAQTGCFLQESRFITLHKSTSFVQKVT